ncbi:MAG TPA: hypothetical protein DEA73_09350 [Peptococcaceae bacterium]|nr:MAG: hypothetical protein XD51_0657 [Moorella sp. 60_41]HBT48059.1 hypothetical protein [Peptococcaceae bacterium]
MAVVVTPVGASLRLQVQTGTDAEGGPVYRWRTFSRVKPEAADQDLWDVAQALAALQVYPVVAVNRVQEASLSA